MEGEPHQSSQLCQVKWGSSKASELFERVWHGSRTLSNLATGYSAQYKVTATKPVRSFLQCFVHVSCFGLLIFFFTYLFMLQSVTFVHVSHIGGLQVTQLAISIGKRKVIVTNIISNKWYTGRYKEVSHSLLRFLPKQGRGTLKLESVFVFLFIYRCLRCVRI